MLFRSVYPPHFVYHPYLPTDQQPWVITYMSHTCHIHVTHQMSLHIFMQSSCRVKTLRRKWETKSRLRSGPASKEVRGPYIKGRRCLPFQFGTETDSDSWFWPGTPTFLPRQCSMVTTLSCTNRRTVRTSSCISILHGLERTQHVYTCDLPLRSSLRPGVAHLGDIFVTRAPRYHRCQRGQFRLVQYMCSVQLWKYCTLEHPHRVLTNLANHQNL